MSFKATNWTPNELLGEAKTDQMGDNAEYLFENTPRAIYTLPGNLRRVLGVKIASGRVRIAKNPDTDSAHTNVRLGNFFTANCEPIITTGVVSTGAKVFCVVNGLGQLLPDNTGFQIKINIGAEAKKNDKIAHDIWIAWMAMGY